MCENVWCGSQWVPVIGMCSKSCGVRCGWVNDTREEQQSVVPVERRKESRAHPNGITGTSAPAS